MEFSISTNLKGALVKNPDKVLPIFNKEFRAGLNESAALVHYETVLRTPQADGYLRKSITTTEPQGSGLDMQVATGTPLIYAAPVEQGAMPHFPPLGPIELWVKRKGLDLSYTGTRLTIREVAFLVARKISEVGLDARWMFRDGLEASKQRIVAILEAAQGRVMEALK